MIRADNWSGRACARLSPGVCSGLFLAGIALGAFARELDVPSGKALPLMELREAVQKQGRSIISFTAQGVVCAAAPERNLLTLQDDSGALVLEVPALNSNILAGDLVELRATNCAVTRSRFGLQLGTAPVVKNDGHHPALPKTGKVFLEAGLQPIHLTWFNGYGLSALIVEYEGPQTQRQVLPSEALFRGMTHPAEKGGLEPGLDYEAYTGSWYFSLPDFASLKPVARGVATNFDLRYSVQPENAALSFTGYLNVANPGIYTFYLNSDDGGYLYVGNPVATCQVRSVGHVGAPVPLPLEVALRGGSTNPWASVEGDVVFVGQKENDVELELAGKAGERVQVTLLDGLPLLSSNLFRRQIQVSGILETRPDPDSGQPPRLLVPGPAQIGLRSPRPAPLAGRPNAPALTSVDRIRRLTLAEAASKLPVRVHGVVLWSSHSACVLQDATGGVYVHYTATDWTDEPTVGEAWELEGTTDPGDFSPVIYADRASFLGPGVMPEPIRPTGDQLMNGSLDAEYVELRGVLTSITDQALTLLTAEGNLTIMGADDRPLPRLPSVPLNRSLVDSIVRLRGCFTVFWEHDTRQVRSGVCLLSPAAVEVEELAPEDPFTRSTRSAADLLHFDPNASALQRTKVKGQIIFGQDREFFLEDADAGVRLQTKESLKLTAGTLVEAVGFPQLGGPSPVLQEARVRALTQAPLPAPTLLPPAELLNRRHDSTLVQIEAVLAHDRIERSERVLELQAGQVQFTARLPARAANRPPLEPGSRLLVTGVYLGRTSQKAGGDLDAFELGLSQPSELTVIARPPWWTLQRAGEVLAILAAGLGVALIWITALRRKVEERTGQLRAESVARQRVEQRRLVEQERTRVAQDLHDELGAGLTEMGLLGDLVKNPAVPGVEKQRYLVQLTEMARSLVSSLDEIVWAINPHYDTVASLASYYTLFAQRFLDLAGVACRPQIPSSFPDYPLDSKERHDLFLAFREALNNVVRHSGATEVRLGICVRNGELVVSVADNGRGFAGAVETPGADGLQGMRRRMEELGGSCEIESRRGAGTVVELRLPIPVNSLST